MMLETPVKKLIISMAVPTIIGQLITIIYNLTDMYFVSSLGTNATAAVGVNSTIERVISMVGMFLASGCASYVSRLLGAKEKDHADRVQSTCMFIGMGFGVLVMIFGLITMKDMVFWLGATEECAPYSMQYAQYVLLAAPFMIGSFILQMALRSEGSAKLSMIGISFGGILNCILDPIFIFKLGLGVAGASMATAISKFVSFCILLYPYLKHKTEVRISLKKFKIVKHDAFEVSKIGSTSLFRTVCMVTATIIMNHLAGNFSTAALAAVSVSNRVMEFPFGIILGFGQGYQPVVGFSWGAKAYERARDGFKFALQMAVIGSLVMGGILFLAAGPVIKIFNKAADPEVMRLGMLCVRAQCVTMIFHCFGMVNNMFFAGIGDAKRAVPMSIARQGIFFIPLLLIIPRLFGAEGLACTQAAADVGSLVLIIPMTIHAFKMLRELIEGKAPVEA